jgi:hypothetical protein
MADSLFDIVPDPIDLDSQPRSRAMEVENVRPNRMLTAEAHTVQLSTA